MTRREAAKYLAETSSLLHASAYRVLFPKHADGERAGQYRDLDFGDLAYLDALDLRLRRAFLDASLDVEAAASTKLVHVAGLCGEDGYSIVAYFKGSLGPPYRARFGPPTKNGFVSYFAFLEKVIDKWFGKSA